MFQDKLRVFFPECVTCGRFHLNLHGLRAAQLQGIRMHEHTHTNLRSHLFFVLQYFYHNNKYENKN